MIAGFAPATVALIAGIVLLGGTVKGLAGFGYAVAGTAILATVLDPTTAITVMILPMLAANVSLLRELDAGGIRSCVRRFWPYVAAAAVGTAAGMTALGAIPKPALAVALGAVTLGYVGVKQDAVVLPGERWIARECFTEATAAKVGLGLVSGVIFGASNIGVQVVAYLDSLSLDRSTFVGVLSMILVGISTVRVGLAWTLGLYEAGGLLVVSVGAVVPGLIGVALGARLRERIPARLRAAGVLSLLSVIGLRLVYVGARGL